MKACVEDPFAPLSTRSNSLCAMPRNLDAPPDGARAEHRLDTEEASAWKELLAWRSGRSPGRRDSGHPLFDVYAPLLVDTPATFAVGHLAQSLDGRIATTRGHSRWISGSAGLMHAHRMRALFDAVVVGSETATLDDPELTVRHVDGPNPVRVVVDRTLRSPPTLRLYSDGLAPTIVITSTRASAGRSLRGLAEVVGLPEAEDHTIAPAAILEALAARGHRRVLVEGGGITVSRFLSARCLSRLHLTIAPLLLGSGRPSVVLPGIAEISEGQRPRTRQFRLGDETLVDCILASAHR
jgi:riboflavin-specific deaminase-like protein